MCDQLLLKVREAARLLGFGRSMTYEFIRRGELKSVKVGGARRVLVSDLHEFVQQLKDANADDGI